MLILMAKTVLITSVTLYRRITILPSTFYWEFLLIQET